MDLTLEGGDLKISQGDLLLNDGVDAIAQHLKIRLRFFRGEWFLNLDEGVPYFQEVLRKNPSSRALGAFFRNIIVNTPGIASVGTVTLDYDAGERTLDVQFTATTVDGETITYDSFLVV